MKKLDIKNLQPGDYYTNAEIMEIFKCSNNGGMRRSTKTNTLVLFTDSRRNNLYEDKWINNVLHYTGMGQKGDQKIDGRGNQNKTLSESRTNGVDIHLVETVGENRHRYLGRVELVGSCYTTVEKDRNGLDRKVFKFPLRLISGVYPHEEGKNTTTKYKHKSRKRKIDDITLEELAIRNSERNEKYYEIKDTNLLIEESVALYRTTTIREYIRNPEISLYIKRLANGICQLCETRAPFEKNGEPFLHSHHIEYLSEGGKDIVDNCIAVCPNCHARLHELELEEDKQKLINKVQQRKGEREIEPL